MHAWESIQATIEYINSHLTEDTTTEELAKIAALSPFYYQRLFNRLVGKPVKEYIKLRRLAIAAELLPNKDRRIIDVAMETGFGSHETFTRAFKDAFGMTPEQYRANPVRLNQFTKPELLLKYTLIDENVPLISNGIVLEINRKRLDRPQSYIGLTTQLPIERMPSGTDTGVDALGDLWDSFHQRKSSIPGLVQDGEEIGVSTMGTQEGTMTYLAGALAETSDPVEGYTSWEMPAGEYIVCSSEAEDFEHLVMDAIYKAYDYLFQIWLPNHQLITQPFCAERYARHDPAATGIDIWVIPVPMNTEK